MLPWEHAAVAYLCYVGYARWHAGAPPAGWAVLVVLFASQLPDLIDKPLAWQVGLLPSGRSLAHSVFVGVPLSAAVLAVARRHGTPSLGMAFAIGYLSHLATDAVAGRGVRDRLPLASGDRRRRAVPRWLDKFRERALAPRGLRVVD